MVTKDKVKEFSEKVWAINSLVSRQDFTKAFELLAKVVVRVEENLVKKIDDLIGRADEKVASLKDGRDGADGKDGKTPTKQELLTLITPLIPEVKDGETPSEEQLATLIKQILPTFSEETMEDIIAYFEANLPMFAKSFRDGLETLEGDERLDASAIKGLEEIVKLSVGAVNTVFVPAGSGGGGRTVKIHDLSDSLDGSTKTFALPAFWKVLSVHLSSFPYTLRPIVDFTTDAAAMTITFTSEIDAATSLATGQTALVEYVE